MEGGTAVWIRPDLARATHAKAMREQMGLRTVAETDDNYLASKRFNIYMRTNGFDAKYRLDHMKAMASMNAMVFSTDTLRDFYWRELRKAFGQSRLPDAFVCRNHCPEQDWPERVETDGPVRVGWMGSPSHIWDVDLAWPALLHAHNIGCETWMVGYDPTNPEHAVTSERSRHMIDQWAKVGFRFQDWETRDHSDMRRMRLPLDIGLCPLLANEFTLGKSDIKAVEYAVAGAAVVAWNNTVYNRTWVHGETALLVGSPSEAIDAVDLLARDDNLRLRLVENARQYVREERGNRQLREEWGEVLG
jgi:glycosyltransferase involved in cell wall biosynthesis